MKILIIEDEQWVAEELAETLKEINSNIEILGILNSVEESIRFFNTQPDIDLIFSDIQLGDGLSFEIFQNKIIYTPVIFCTAYNEFMLQAFRANGIDYILKPFSKKTLSEALLKYASMRKAFTKDLQIDYKNLMQKVTLELPKSQTIIIKYRDQILPLKLDKIAFFYIENGVTYVHTHQQKKYVYNGALEELEKKTQPVFYRVNRQYLVNKNAIKNAVELFSRKIKIELSIPWDKEILVSKEKKTSLLNWLETNK